MQELLLQKCKLFTHSSKIRSSCLKQCSKKQFKNHVLGIWKSKVCFFFISSIIDFREKIKYVAWNENQKYLVALYWAKISYFWRVEKKFEFCEKLKLVHQEKLSSWKLFYINDIFSSTMQGGGDRQNICEM